MLDNTYAPNVVRVEPGTDVRFVGAGRAPHNAVAFDESWSTEDMFGDIAMQQGDATSVTFDTPGVYDFFCTFHATRTDDGYEGMVGTIIGLVSMLGNLSDPSSLGPSMAVAFLTTLWGAFLANVVFMPIASKRI